MDEREEDQGRGVPFHNSQCFKEDTEANKSICMPTMIKSYNMVQMKDTTQYRLKISYGNGRSLPPLEACDPPHGDTSNTSVVTGVLKLIGFHQIRVECQDRM